MAVITRTVEISDLSPEELAFMFCEYSNEQQADFFHHIGEMAKAWAGAGWCQQSYSINQVATNEAKDVIRTIARHVFDREDI